MVPITVGPSCILSEHLHLRRTPSATIGVVNWKEAKANGCHQIKQIVQQLAIIKSKLKAQLLPDLDVVIISSQRMSNTYFGGLYSERYGDYISVVPQNLRLVMVGADTGDVLSHILRETYFTSREIIIELTQDPGPWNIMLRSNSFKVLQIFFFVLMIFNLIYAAHQLVRLFAESAKRAFIRQVILSASFFYIIVLIIVPSNLINSPIGLVFQYLSWLSGYIAYCLLLISWGRIIRAIYRKQIFVVFFVLNYVGMAFFTLIVIILIGGVVAVFRPLLVVAAILIVIVAPAVFILQAINLLLFGILFLRMMRSIKLNVAVYNALRKHSSSVPPA
ncbi:hypothetical protein H4R33_004256 [Dimargaris cristalligena]|nr:hypothetical protein H4R33_004256 [Dimargaris cristalligena]